MQIETKAKVTNLSKNSVEARDFLRTNAQNYYAVCFYSSQDMCIPRQLGLELGLGWLTASVVKLFGFPYLAPPVIVMGRPRSQFSGK